MYRLVALHVVQYGTEDHVWQGRSKPGCHTAGSTTTCDWPWKPQVSFQSIVGHWGSVRALWVFFNENVQVSNQVHTSVLAINHVY